MLRLSPVSPDLVCRQWRETAMRLAAHTMVATVSVALCMQAICSAGDVSVIAAPGGGTPVMARCDAAGTIHLLCDAKGKPYYVRSVDGGKTFGQPLAVVDQKAQKPGLEFIVWDMAVAKDGTVHAALGTNA